MTVEQCPGETADRGQEDPLRVLVLGLQPHLGAALEATLGPLHPQVAIMVSSPVDSADTGPGDPTVVVIGTGAIHIDGAAVVDMRRDLPSVPVVIVSEIDDDDAVLAALGNGVAGYLLAGIKGQELMGALRRAALGEIVVDPEVGGRIAYRVARGMHPASPTRRSFDLRPREHEVLESLLEGRSNRDIARALNISEETVKSHLRTIYRKLGVSSRAEAIVVALRQRPA